MSHSHVPSSRWIEGISTIQAPEEVQTMLSLAAKGWGAKRIARELGCSKNTVKRYLRQGGWKPYKGPNRQPLLAEMSGWLREKFLKHSGNADVVRQELKSEKGVEVCLRTVERAVADFRREDRVKAEATVRFETAPGHQLQIDFGSKTVLIAGKPTRVFVFVATLGYSRRIYVEAFLHERQSAWFQGLEGAFRHFGGITVEVLVDNASALVKTHNRETGELVFNDRFLAFAKYWGFTRWSASTIFTDPRQLFLPIAEVPGMALWQA